MGYWTANFNSVEDYTTGFQINFNRRKALRKNHSDPILAGNPMTFRILLQVDYRNINQATDTAGGGGGGGWSSVIRPRAQIHLNKHHEIKPNVSAPCSLAAVTPKPVGRNMF